MAQEIAKFSPALNSYYENIYKAEKKLIIGQNQEASKYYSIAFQKNKQPFFQDLYNSFIVNAKLKNSKAIDDYNSLKKINYDFKEIKDSLFYKNFLNSNSNKLKQLSTEKKINLELRNTLDSLYSEDQKVRMQSLADQNQKKKVRKTDSLNALKLKSLFDKYGFISEYDIGLTDNPNKRFLPYQIIILHQQQYNHEKFVNFEPYLVNALFTGKISNRIFSFLIEGLGNTSKNYNFFDIIVLDNKIYVDKRILIENQSSEDKVKISVVNNNRKKINLANLQDQILTKFFSSNHSIYLLELDQKKIFQTTDNSFRDYITSRSLELTNDLINKIKSQY